MRKGKFMSQVDEGSNLSETEGQQGQTADGGRLVPVVESIRYHRRAQAAEKRSEELSAELAEAKEQISKMTGELAGIKTEQKLTRKLAEAGANDLEAAILLARTRLAGESDSEIDSAVEQVQKEKPYLFGRNTSGNMKATATAGAKDKLSSSQAVLERAAKRAAVTGDRRDLQEYLRIRRNHL